MSDNHNSNGDSHSNGHTNGHTNGTNGHSNGHDHFDEPSSPSHKLPVKKIPVHIKVPKVSKPIIFPATNWLQ